MNHPTSLQTDQSTLEYSNIYLEANNNNRIQVIQRYLANCQNSHLAQFYHEGR